MAPVPLNIRENGHYVRWMFEPKRDPSLITCFIRRIESNINYPYSTYKAYIRHIAYNINVLYCRH